MELVVPELRRRGLLPEHYAGTTLREELHGPGQVRLRADHAGARFAVRAVTS